MRNIKNINLSDIVAIAACRTAMGRFGGTLRDIPSWELGSYAVREALKRIQKTYCIASICGGGGVTSAMIIKRES